MSFGQERALGPEGSLNRVVIRTRKRAGTRRVVRIELSFGQERALGPESSPNRGVIRTGKSVGTGE
ncbi:hypothetical protein DOE78_23730 [Bacillus sp. Y1]|nr:hypothetical protein DOE78_23730 [Bacillus sp. Y1]